MLCDLPDPPPICSVCVCKQRKSKKNVVMLKQQATGGAVDTYIQTHAFIYSIYVHCTSVRLHVISIRKCQRLCKRPMHAYICVCMYYVHRICINMQISEYGLCLC